MSILSNIGQNFMVALASVPVFVFEAMRLGKLGEQVVLKSRKAFEALTFVEAIKAPRYEYFGKYKSRDEEARSKYRLLAAQPMAEEGTYIIDIIRNHWRNGQGI